MPIKTKKILILTTSYLPLVGGSEIAIKEITERLSDFEFDLVTGHSPASSPKEEKMGPVNVFRVGGCFSLSKFLLPKNFLPISIFLKARELVKKRGPYALVHIFQASQAAGAAWLLKFFYPNLKVLLTLQEGQDLKKQDFLKKFFRRLIFWKVNSVTAISNYLKSYVLSLKSKMPVFVIPNGVDAAKFSQGFNYGELSALAGSLGILSDEKVIISVSRLVPKNGLDVLIESFVILNDKDTGVRLKLLIIGSGSEEESLKFKVKSLKLEDKVLFAGSVSQEEIPKYLKISHVFVRPSRSEGLGISFLEAMAAGVPIVGTSVGGIPDFLEDGETGLFCEVNNAEDLAEKMQTLLLDGVMKKKLVFNARRLVEEKYTWDKIAKDYQETYEAFNSYSSL